MDNGFDESFHDNRDTNDEVVSPSVLDKLAFFEKQLILNKSDCTMIPDGMPNNNKESKRLGTKGSANTPLISEDGLILPKKPMNPCLESMDRQNLHRELLFNQKIGKNVLNQKSELQRALEKHKEAQQRRESEKNVTNLNPEFERVIAERAKKLIQSQPPTQEELDKSLNKQFLEARAKLRARTESN